MALLHPNRKSILKHTIPPTVTERFTVARIVERGYVEGTGFVDAAKKVDAELNGKEMSAPFMQTWRRFNGSFSSNTKMFIAELHGAASPGIAHIGSGDVNGTVRHLRELGSELG